MKTLLQFKIGEPAVTLILNADSILGTFVVGEEIQGTSGIDDYFIKANVTGIGTKNITNVVL